MERSDSRSVLVVGGGVFGLTAAIELRRRGWRVRLVDAGPIPCEAASSTDISKAVRMDYGSDAFYAELAERSLRFGGGREARTLITEIQQAGTSAGT